MDLLDRFNELDEIVSTLNMLIKEIQSRHDKEFFEEILRDYEKEKDYIENQLEEEEEEEKTRMDKEYWADQF